MPGVSEPPAADYAAPLRAYLGRLGADVTRAETKIRCPGSAHVRGDVNPSLGVALAAATWFCHVCKVGGGALELVEYLEKCDRARAREILGLGAPRAARNGLGRIVATYPYHDEQGELLFEVVRFEPKDFRQRAADGTWKTSNTRKVLFRLPEIIAAVAAKRIIYVVEGEKDALALVKLGLDATTNAGGAGKWRDDYSAAFRGADVVVIPDADAPGSEHASQVVASLLKVGATVRRLEMSHLKEKPGSSPVISGSLKESLKDISDWIAAGGTRAELERLAGERPVEVAVRVQSPFNGNGNGSHPASPVGCAPGSRIRIHIEPRVDIVASEAEQAMVALGDGLYSRGDEIVRVWANESGAAPQTHEVSVPMVIDILSLSADWLEWSKKSDTYIICQPPRNVAEIVFARGGRNVLRRLKGIVTTPTLRVDGSVLDRPGWDEQSGLLYDPLGVVYPKIPDRPTRDEALAAVALLKEPLCDIPFVAPSDRSAELALILTNIARQAIEGPTPFFPVSASGPGHGKNLLVDIAAMIATGREAPRSAQKERPEAEMDWLFSLGRDGIGFALIDNCEKMVGSDVLSAALTARTIRDRVKGVSRTAEVPVPVLAATGINIQLRSDLVRRSVLIEIDAGVERPEERRDFRYPDLLGWVRSHRPELVAAALTILRWYVAEGRPKSPGLSVFGSFEAWSDLIRQPLVLLGEPDPLEGRKRLREDADAALEALKSFLAIWSERLGSGGWTVEAMCAAAARTGEEELRRAILDLDHKMDSEKGLDPRKVGYALRKIQRRTVGGLKLVNEKVGRSRVWTVTQCGSAIEKTPDADEGWPEGRE